MLSISSLSSITKSLQQIPKSASTFHPASGSQNLSKLQALLNQLENSDPSTPAPGQPGGPPAASTSDPSTLNSNGTDSLTIGELTADLPAGYPSATGGPSESSTTIVNEGLEKINELQARVRAYQNHLVSVLNNLSNKINSAGQPGSSNSNLSVDPKTLNPKLANIMQAAADKLAEAHSLPQGVLNLLSG